jgi:hypothetical protein
MAIKSLVTHVEVDTAGKAHNCQAGAKHRIEKGDIRLKVRNGRSWDHSASPARKISLGGTYSPPESESGNDVQDAGSTYVELAS